MNDESITSSISSGLRSLGGKLRNSVFGLLKKSKGTDDEKAAGETKYEREAAPGTPARLDAGLISKASQEILAYVRQNQPLLDRAERYGNRAERLSESGATSESASNKAERARQEILAGLAALRESFVERNGSNTEKAAAAFDHESRNALPDLAAN